MRDFIEKSYEYIYEKINSLSDITQFEFLNMTFSISEISQEVLNNVAKTLKEQVDNQMITIYNDKLGELKEEVKIHLDEHFETFDKLINYEHEATVTKYRLNSKTDTSLENVKFQEVTKKELFNSLDLFFEKVKEVYSQTSVTEFLYENQNTAIINHPFKTYFTEVISTAIYNEIINITELSYSRYSIERNKFKQNIKIFYIKAFKRIFSQFVKNKGKDYLDYSLNNDYKKRIYPDFNLMINSMNDTYSFVKVLLNTSELKGLGTILASRFVNIYPEIREKLNLIIPDKVPNVIYPKIDEFRKVVKKKISSLFVETMENENRLIESKLSKKVYNLIPKYLGTPFKGIIEDQFENIEIYINAMKQTYNSKVTSSLNKVRDKLFDDGKIVSKNVTSAAILEPGEEWFNMIEYYKKFNTKVNSYKENYKFNVSTEKNEAIVSFYQKKIIPSLTIIVTGFDESIRIGQTQLENTLSTFKVESLVNPTLENILKSKMKDNVETTQKSMNSTIENLKKEIISKFENFSEILNNNLTDINITGFDSNSNNLRNLEENYDLYEIENIFDEFENQYYEFRKNILTSDKYYEVTSKRSGFVIHLMNSASTLTNNFYAYNSLMEQYTDNPKLKEYFTLLENDAKKVRDKVTNFVISVSNKTILVLDTIYKGMNDSWPEIKNKSKEYIDKALNQIFKEKLSNLKNISGTFDIDNNQLNTITVDLKTPNNEPLSNIELNINLENLKRGYGIKKLNDYDFEIDVFVGGGVDLIFKTYVGEQIIETIGNKLASGTVGINANYTLHNKDVYIDAYAKLNESNYFVNVTSVNDNKDIFSALKYVSGRNVSMKRTLRRTKIQS